MGILRADRITGLGGADAIKGSVKFGNNHALEIHPNSADYRLGSNDFTIEFWGNTIGTGNAIMVGLFENNPARRSYTLETRANRALRFECWSDGSSALKTLTSNTGVWELSTWHYFTVVRNGTALNIYVDGTSIASTTFDNASDSLYENTVDPLVLGASKQGNVYYATHGTLYISNFRLTNGTALYTSNFTPPNRELTKLSTTNVLCCQSSANALKEETGKTIVAVTNNRNSAPPEASKFTPNSPVGFSTTTDVGSQYGATFDGFTVFATSTYMVPPGGNTRERNRGRAIFAGGARSPGLKIQVLDIASGGIAQDFGDLLNTGDLPGSASSTTRMLVASGYIAPASSNVIEFITIADIASSTDFGDLTEARRRPQGLSNSTRGAFVGGQTPTAVNTIDFVTIATAGNAADFGDTNAAVAAHGGAVASSTRGVYTIGGHPAYTNTIEFITIATTGNGQDFGDLTVDANRGYQDRGSICDTTRGIFSGGFTGSNVLSNTIEFITMATTGNSTNFGDLPVARRGGFGTSNSRLAIFAGGYTPGSFKNAIDQVTIQTTGNATDFGDLVFATQESSGSSDSHGGL